MSISAAQHISAKQPVIIPQQNAANQSAAVSAATSPSSKVTGSGVQPRVHYHHAASGGASWQSALLTLQTGNTQTGGVTQTRDPRDVPEAGKPGPAQTKIG